MVLDERGRAWTFGENKYGQLGRDIGGRKFDVVPGLVEGVGEIDLKFQHVACGWSHTVARCFSLHETRVNRPDLLGWGRNDKGLLGTGSTENLLVPTQLFENVIDIQSYVCGSESTMILDELGNVLGCGWNEHGNLALGNDTDSLSLQSVTGARVVAPPSTQERWERTMGGSQK